MLRAASAPERGVGPASRPGRRPPRAGRRAPATASRPGAGRRRPRYCSVIRRARPRRTCSVSTSVSLVLPACTASVSRIVSRSRMLTRSRSRFCKTRWSSPARSRPGTTSSTSAGDVARARSRSRPTCSRVISSSACPSTISPKWPATTAEASRIRQPASSATSRPSAWIQTAGWPVTGSTPSRPSGRVDQPGRRHGQEPAGVGDPLPDHRPADLEPVLVRAQADLVADPHLRHDQARGRGPPAAGPSGAGRAGRRRASGRPARSGDSRSPAPADRRGAGLPSAPTGGSAERGGRRGRRRPRLGSPVAARRPRRRGSPST